VRTRGSSCGINLSNMQQEVSAINGEYKKIIDRVKVIDRIVGDIEDSRTEFVQDVLNFEKEYDRFERDSREIAPHGRLAKLTDMLDRWAREPVSTMEDIKKFAH
jgi:hypothetical protein